MKLNLLIDTSAWLDLAKDYRQLPLLEALFAMIEVDEVSLILPQLVVDEFERNKDRVVADSRRSLSSHFKRVREAVAQFAPEEARDATLQQLNEVDHRIATGPETVNEGVGLVEKLFAMTTPVPLDESIKVRAADRAIAKLAPFHRPVNGIGDAIIIETYIDALNDRPDPEDVYAFVTHNIHDFSDRGADTRLPHPDLASLFDGARSRYVTCLGPLLGEFAEELIEEIRFDREFSQEPRSFSELLEAERKLFKQVWYNRHRNLRSSIERGKHRLVTSEEWEKATPRERQGMTIDAVWEGALAAARRAEGELGPENIGPWDDFEWGMLNGKLSALRWVMGDEWDMLDT
jgi:hypothetical protein